MIRLLEWFRREWILPIGMFAAAVGGFLSALGGSNGFTAVGGGVVILFLLIAGLTRPAVAPYFLVGFIVFDRDLHLSENVQITTLNIVLLALAPGFLRLIITTKAIPRFAVVGAGMLTVGLAAACLGAAQPNLALAGLLKWVPVLVMIGGIRSLVAVEPQLLRRLGSIVLLGGSVAGVFGILQRTGHYWLVGPPYAQDVTDSTFGYYTNFANFEALASVIGFALIIEALRSKGRPPLVLAGGTGLCLFMVVTSYSRGAVVLVAVGIFVILIYQFANPARLVAALGVLALAGWLVVQFAPPEYVDEIVAKFANAQNGDVVRSQLQTGGLHLLLTKPLGIGFNNFSALVASGDIYATLALAHSHNTFIQMGLDAGWLGALGFLVLISGAFWHAFRARKTNMGAVVLAYSAALAGFLVQVSQDYFFFEEASLVVFGLLIAGSFGVPVQPRNAEDRRQGTGIGTAARQPGFGAPPPFAPPLSSKRVPV